MANVFTWPTPTIIRNNAEPVNPDDVATKSYVDNNSGGSPGGANSQVQFNRQGVFTGSANLTFDGTNLAVAGRILGRGMLGPAISINSNTAELVLQSGIGNIDVTNSWINNLRQPEEPQDAATKSYVDALVQGLQVLQPCNYATNSPLPPFLYFNGISGFGATITLNAPGALSVDSFNPQVGDRVLIKDQPLGDQGYANGIYVVTVAGDDVTQAVLTRANDNDTPASFVSAYSFIEGGRSNGFSGWICTVPPLPPVVIGTDHIEWAQFSQAGVVEAGRGLDLEGTLINVLVDNRTLGINTDNQVYVLDEAQFVQPDIGVATGQDLSLTDYLTVGKDATVSGILYTTDIETTGNIVAEGDVQAADITAAGNVSAGVVLTETVSGFGLTLETTGANTNIVFEPQGNVSVSLKNIINLALPVNPNDAVNKEYVDDAISSSTYGDGNVASYLATNTGPITAPTLTTNTNTTAVATTAFVQNALAAASTYGNAQVASYLSSGTLSTNIVTAGNISGDFILGDGSLLTGLPQSYTNANVAAFLPTYTGGLQSLQGPVTTTGNVTALFFKGNGSELTGMYNNLNVQAYLPTYTGDLNPSDVRVTGNLTYVTLPNSTNNNLVATTAYVQNVVEALGGYGNAQVAEFLPTYSGDIGGNIGLNVTGTLTARTVINTSDNSDNVATTAFVQAVVTAEGGYGNAQVAAYLPTYTGNLVSLTGDVVTSANIQGSFVKGNGSQLTGMYGNTQVASYLPTYTGGFSNLTANVTTTGNVQALYFKGDGSQLTNLPVPPTNNYGNSNVQSYLSSSASGAETITIATVGNISTAANISGSFILGNGRFLTGIVSSYGNSNVQTYLPTYSGNIGNNVGLTVTGNLSAVTPANGTNTTQVATTAFVQSALTIANAYGNANVQAYLPTYTGNLSPGNILTNNYLYANGQPFNTFANVFVTNTATIGNIVLTESNINLGNNSISTGNGVSIGRSAKATNSTVAIGVNAGNNSTATAAVAVGNAAGQTNQGNNTVAVGSLAGQTNQGINAVAVGAGAGENTQGNNAVAIGAFAGANSQVANSIIINASGTALNGNNAGLYIKPIRNDNANIAQSIYFNPATSEITYAPSPAASTYGNANVQAFLQTYTGNVQANVIITNRLLVQSSPNVVATGNTTVYTASSGSVTGFRLTLKANVGGNCVQMVDVMAGKDTGGNVGYTAYSRVNTNTAVPNMTVAVDINGTNQLIVIASSTANTTYTYDVVEFN